ncbi:hypothetical protein KUTeg_023585 [Tegillarca granosa]|uniref:17-beta-hydroxysteroid dehydrogenase 14 n=1 Tax=Tegillarca granosa TaxID=220873 RepID=A0ABQ9E312_TEGGR|nr:hypothetical protein KUTeg_023585 [Tegillarca granosa]
MHTVNVKVLMASTMCSPTQCYRYKDKITIITGGSSGIGRGCVEVFVKHGSKVVFCSNAPEEGRAVEAEMNKIGECYFIPCDVTQEKEIENVVQQTVEKYGRIDCLINNAGIHPPSLPIDEFSGDGFRKLLDINVVGYFLFAKHALPYLRKTAGNIINTSSLVAQMAQSMAVTYVATKGAITAFTKALAIDEAKYNVRVNSFSPGNVWTPLWEHFLKDYSETDRKKIEDDGKNASVLGRFGTPEECGLTCLYLAADATFCTGVDINLSGGAELGYGIKAANALV